MTPPENFPGAGQGAQVKEKQATSRKFSGFLDDGTSFDGDLRFEGTLRIDGDLSGSVTTTDTLIVGASATVRANITAGAIQVHGRVFGDVSCSGRVEICEGGHLEGKIQAPRLIIEDGGVFEGQSHRTEGTPTDSARVAAVAVAEQDETSSGEPHTSTADGEPQPARQNLTRWKILGKQLEALRTRTPAAEEDGE
jgi:cytoskeletal protein CcmA (bactofilin family)